MSRFLLSRDASGYALIDQINPRRVLRIDFGSARWRQRLAGSGRELLTRAVAAKPGQRVLDCTAGLGADSFLLAWKGCEVTLIERSNTLYLMLEDALQRARQVQALDSIVARLDLRRGDARQLMMSLASPPDVILIDPMFPARRKTAEVKGDLQLLQQFVGKQEDVLTLLDGALQTGCKRIVVKRPLRGGELPGYVPTGSVVGKASRFDLFTSRR